METPEWVKARRAEIVQELNWAGVKFDLRTMDDQKGVLTKFIADPFPDYESLRDHLKTLPATWYPDLLATLVEAAYSKKVFVPRGASAFIGQTETRLGQPEFPTIDAAKKTPTSVPQRYVCTNSSCEIEHWTPVGKIKTNVCPECGELGKPA